MSKNSPSAIASGISSGGPRGSAPRSGCSRPSPRPRRRGRRRCCGRSRWLTTPRRTPARIDRTCACLTAGKNSTSRRTVSAASIVCIVEKTRCPDSAAWSAVSAVSASRSSPIRITSGSWRSTRRSASSKEAVSSPTSRWLTIAALVGVEDLDRVLDRDDVLAPRPVDVADHRRERRRLADAGRAGDEDEAVVVVGEPLDAGGKPELLEARARRSGSRGTRTRSRRAAGRR